MRRLTIDDSAAGSSNVAGTGGRSRHNESGEKADVDESCRPKQQGPKAKAVRGSKASCPGVPRGATGGKKTLQARTKHRTRDPAPFREPEAGVLSAGGGRRSRLPSSLPLVESLSLFPRVEQPTDVRRGPARLKQNPGPGFLGVSLNGAGLGGGVECVLGGGVGRKEWHGVGFLGGGERERRGGKEGGGGRQRSCPNRYGSSSTEYSRCTLESFPQCHSAARRAAQGTRC